MTAVWMMLALIVALAPAALAQQPNFRVTYTVDGSDGSQTRIRGTVVNDSRVDVLDVYVTAEALDRTGKVAARGISFVATGIPERGSAPFTASVPAGAGATAFRVYVSSFRPGFGVQSQ